jgi:hypothetical protein
LRGLLSVVRREDAVPKSLVVYVLAGIVCVERGVAIPRSIFLFGIGLQCPKKSSEHAVAGHDGRARRYQPAWITLLSGVYVYRQEREVSE